MFTSLDKAIVAGLGALVAMLVSTGFISEEQGSQLTNILVTAGTAVVSAVVTYLWPNKS